MTGSSPSSQSESTSLWVIDQMEGGVASIEVDGQTTISYPCTSLPKGVNEGDVLRVTIVADPAELAKRLAESAAQVARGGKGGKGNIKL